MKLKVKRDLVGIDWECVKNLLHKESMATYSVEKHKQAFANSAQVIFLYDDSALIGCGRLISDFAYQGAIYDVAVDSRYQGMGIGKLIIKALIQDAGDINILLYATPGKEEFYAKLGFCRVKTGMCRFLNADSARKKGIIE